jgi:hypothetical protein
VSGKDTANHVLVDLDSESQGDQLSDARTAPGRVAILHLDHGSNQFVAGTLGSRLTPALK